MRRPIPARIALLAAPAALLFASCHASYTSGRGSTIRLDDCSGDSEAELILLGVYLCALVVVEAGRLVCGMVR